MKLLGRKKSGQGMVEYIIIVALIAIAAIAAFKFFGSTVRSQVGGMAAELAGEDAKAVEAQKQAADKAQKAIDEGAANTNLKNYTDQNEKGAK